MISLCMDVVASGARLERIFKFTSTMSFWNGTPMASASAVISLIRLKGLAAQQGQPGNIVRLAGGEHLIAGGLVEGLAVGKIPGHGVEAAGAAVAAAGNKYAGAHAGPVGNVVILDGCVVHSDTPIKSSPSRGSWQCRYGIFAKTYINSSLLN